MAESLGSCPDYLLFVYKSNNAIRPVTPWGAAQGCTPVIHRPPSIHLVLTTGRRTTPSDHPEPAEQLTQWWCPIRTARDAASHPPHTSAHPPPKFSFPSSSREGPCCGCRPPLPSQPSDERRSRLRNCGSADREAEPLASTHLAPIAEKRR